MHEFDAATAVTPWETDGWFDALVSDGWNSGGVPNGGYLMATMVRAAAVGVPHPVPITTTAHFLARTDPGPASVEVEPIKTGRSASTSEARLHQLGRERIRLLASFADLAAAKGPTVVTGTPPEVPAPDDCIVVPTDPTGMFPITKRFEYRLAPAAAGLVAGTPSGTAEVCGWIRFADGRQPDPLSLVCFADAVIPAVFNLEMFGWVPTLEMTVHVRGLPAPGWLRFRFATRFLVDGYFEEDGELWDEGDRLVAMSRQLARVLS